MKKNNRGQANRIMVLLGLYATLLVNSLLLFALDFNQLFAAYRGTLLFHIAAGTVVILPLLLFLYPHLKTMPHRQNYTATAAGLFLTLSLATTIITGFLLYDTDLTPQKNSILNVHLASVAVTVLGFFIHLKLRRKQHFHFYKPPAPRVVRRSGTRQHPFFKTLFISHLLFALAVLISLPIEQKGAEKTADAFAPGAAVVAGAHYLDPAVLDNSASCGEAGCHPDIHTQWNESAHHFSSFNNPYYQKSIEVMLADNGTEKARWCASCHDPLLLLTGEMQNAEKDFFVNHPQAEKGITCLSCHAVESATDVTGNGNYIIDDPGYEALGRTVFGEHADLRRFFIRTKPEPHGASLSSPYLSSDEFCATCHKVSVPPQVNDYRWKRGQNHYDDWYGTAFSGKHPRAFYSRAEENCISCHMQKVPSQDAGNDDGYIKNHRFAAANTALPVMNNHPQQLDAVRAYLQNDVAETDIFSVIINDRELEPTEVLPPIKAGDEVVLEIVVRNKNTGHSLPSGTNDSNEMWLEVKATDKAGKTVFVSGDTDAGGNTDSTAHFFKAILLDERGGVIDRRNVHDWRATAYKGAIPSGLSHIVRYRFAVPPGAEVSEIQARLNYRKFNAAINNFTFADSTTVAKNREVQAIKDWIYVKGLAPEIPVITLTSAVKNTTDAGVSQTPLWQRYNNYGIALLREENYRKADAIFKKVSTLAPARPDGELNRARALLAEGNVFAAEEILSDLQNRFPENNTVTYFLGQTYFVQGRFDESLVYWVRLLKIYPEDVQLLADLGQIYYQINDYEKAEAMLQSALTINPENYTVIYRMMLLKNATGAEKEAAEWLEKYEFYRPREQEELMIAAFKKKNKIINREAQTVHFHGIK